MLVVSEFEGVIFGRFPAAAAALSGLLIPRAVSPVGVRANRRPSLGVGRFLDGLFPLGNLGGKGRLSRCLLGLGCLLRSVKQGRVLRGGQVCELQIRRSNRHDPILPL